ncbi:hypothetical protein Rhopal_007859-T1 [Rhodotorula paludigena]|uniref:XPA C-terminal domain-containing protein n=1 Tax=Rhodotorula paludigena TaxID=86838 RepID=A0AAV5GZH2_9BASI|nr:hypothetical protein Rhopal_007859-T1 [Rhodotorula paludigena]
MAYVLGTGLPPGVSHSPTTATAAPSYSSSSKRQALSDDFREVTHNIARSTLAKPAWSDIPDWRQSGASYVLDAPASALDRILSDPILTLRDHLALAATCRTLRACYMLSASATAESSADDLPSSPLWKGLLALRPNSKGGQDGETAPASEAEKRAVRKLWSNAVLNGDPDEIEFVGGFGGAGVEGVDPTGVGGLGSKKRKRDDGWEGKVIRSYEWERAILLTQSEMITKTDAKKHYKLTDRDLKYLKCVVKRNPYALVSGAPMNLFVEVAVESLALRLHGGVTGHNALLAKRAASAAKAAATRAANKASRSSSSTKAAKEPKNKTGQPKTKKKKPKLGGHEAVAAQLAGLSPEDVLLFMEYEDEGCGWDQGYTDGHYDEWDGEPGCG